MRRWWLALFMVMMVAGTARAIRPVECACPARVVLPHRGANGVPTNTKVWVLGPEGLEILSPNLDPGAHYHDADRGVVFTTGASRDDVAPEAPRDVHVTIAGHGADEIVIDSVALYGMYAPDTALVRVEIVQNGWAEVLTTTADRLFLCEPTLRLRPGSASITIRAIDLAGNESEPYMTTTNVLVTNEFTRSCSGPVDHGHESHAHRLLPLGVLLIGLALIGGLVFLAVRRASKKYGPGEPLSLLVAEGVTRRLLRWFVLWSAMQIAAVLGLFAAGATALPVGIAAATTVTLLRIANARRLLRLLDRPGALAVRRGRKLTVVAGTASASLRASNQDFVQAERAAIPTTIAR